MLRNGRDPLFLHPRLILILHSARILPVCGEEQKDQRRHSDGASRGNLEFSRGLVDAVVRQEWNHQSGWEGGREENGQLAKWRNKKNTLVVLRRWQKAKVSGLNGITRAVCLRRASRFHARGKTWNSCCLLDLPSPAEDRRAKWI